MKKWMKFLHRDSMIKEEVYDGPLIKLENLVKIYDTGAIKVLGLKKINLTIERGEFVAIMGHSGSGKSTLLRCATLLETMDGGELSYVGQKAVSDEGGRAVYASQAELRKIRSCFGLVFQNFNLFPHYSVLKNIMEAPMLVQKRDAKSVREEALELLEKMGLSDKADAYPYQLSGGQQQRVSIARALAMNPKILFD